MIDDLRDRWERGVVDLGTAVPAMDRALADLLRRHAEPHRRYHSIEHLVEIHEALDALGSAGNPDVDAPAVRLAAWFHDAVYDPTRSDNEAVSARLAEVVLADAGADQQLVVRVAELVEMTASHQPPDGDGEASALCDADLSILAAPAERYVRYRRQVRSEYGHLDDAAWRSGRIAVLSSFLERPHLFATVEGRLRWEDAARANVSAEREILDRDL